LDEILHKSGRVRNRAERVGFELQHRSLSPKRRGHQALPFGFRHALIGAYDLLEALAIDHADLSSLRLDQSADSGLCTVVLSGRGRHRALNHAERASEEISVLVQ
jgi:hypothetical protein